MSSRSWTQPTNGTAGHRMHSEDRDAGRSASDGVVRVFLRGVAESFRRARQRRDLARLTDYGLRDIGLTRHDVELELRKPSWRA